MTNNEKIVLRKMLYRLENEAVPQDQKQYSYDASSGIFGLNKQKTEQAIVSLDQKELINGKGAFTMGEKHCISLTPKGVEWAQNDQYDRTMRGILAHPLVATSLGAFIGYILGKLSI